MITIIIVLFKLTADVMHRPVDIVTEVDLTSEMSPVTSDHKTRFGKPVSEPNLAEDIKGKVFCT